MPLILKQIVSVIDRRTTIVCLHAAGQIQPVDSPFETLNGNYDQPPFHVYCRSVSMPYMAGFVSDEAARANAELQTRPFNDRDFRNFKGMPGPDPVPPSTPRVVGPTPTPATVRPTRTGVAQFDLAALVDAPQRQAGDRILDAVWDQNGFHAPPTQVDAATWAAIASASPGREIYRGVTTVEFADDFRAGARHYPGYGIYGNGSYFARDAAEAARYAGDEAESIVAGLLKADARTIGYEDLKVEHQAALAALEANATAAARDLRKRGDAAYDAGDEALADALDAERSTVRRRAQEARDVLSDPGRYASIAGYDAYSVGDPDDPEAIWVVLNRSAVVVRARS